MISRRPYFLRAMNDWIVDSGHTPHVVIDAHVAGVEAPEGYVNDGKLIVNISPSATQNLDFGNEYLAFDARFGGTPHTVMAPVPAVLAIYARETGDGIVFSDDDEPPSPDPGAGDHPPTSNRPKPGGPPHLKVVK